VLGELRPDQLQPDRQPFGAPAGDREAWHSGHVRGDRQYVREVHGERVLGPRAERERDRWRGRRREQVEALEQLVVLALDQRPHLLRLAVERLVVAGRQRVRAEHDPPLRLVSEPFVPRARVQGANVAVAGGAEPVADAVVAREVRGRLRGRDQVVARQPEVHRARQAALLDLGAELTRAAKRRVDLLGDTGLDAFGLVELLRDADPYTLQILGFGQLDRFRQLDRGRVAGVAPGDRPVEKRTVAHRLGDWADLVEARRERDDAVTADGPVGRTQSDDAAERRRLLDGAARVRAQGPGRHPGCD